MTAEPHADGSGAMFDRIAGRYDLLNRFMSLGMDRRWRRALVAAIGPLSEGDVVLDLATGTADVAIAIAETYPTVRVEGVDPSTEMLAAGQQKLGPLADRIELSVGDAQALDFDDDTFAAATMAFGIRNVPDRPKALRELARVTRPGGKVAILELGEPRRGPLAPFARAHAYHVAPRLGALLSGDAEYAYLARSIAAFPAPEAFQTMMQDAGLSPLSLRPFAFGVANLYLAEVPG
jgi:demethylmenaquinone methyltransferase / 2-methoxy-6-polyprenyl-1,4-benzoquinol methylase